MTQSEQDHIELTVQRMADLHAAHLEGQSDLQRNVSRLTLALSRPRVLALVIVVVFLWIAFNSLAPRFGLAAFDAPPFGYLQTVAAVIALCTTLMILATQAREDEAARRRSQLTLQLASLSEQKIAKVISLLEEQRRDNPQLAARSDPQAEAMAEPADPGHVLDRIEDTHQDG